MSMFSAPALTRPTDGDRRRHDQCSDVVERLPKRARIPSQFRRVVQRIARLKPVHHLGFERFDDQQIHALVGSREVLSDDSLREDMPE